MWLLAKIAVTPLAGVWIEIMKITCFLSLMKSLPLRECGLKSPVQGFPLPPVLSLPLRECGLKYQRSHATWFDAGHSPCGSVDWNLLPEKHWKVNFCHSPCGSVDWNNAVHLAIWFISCHSPCGSVDWNLAKSLRMLILQGHSPCGSVDWNMRIMYFVPLILVTPLAGVWIEITKRLLDVVRTASLPLRECGLKLRMRSSLSGICQVTPLAGVWIEMWILTDRLSLTLSLPLRECGLKSQGLRGYRSKLTSLPLRECGLKFLNNYHVFRTNKSLPLRECGLKSGVTMALRAGSPASLPLRECGLKYC